MPSTGLPANQKKLCTGSQLKHGKHDCVTVRRQYKRSSVLQGVLQHVMILRDSSLRILGLYKVLQGPTKLKMRASWRNHT